MVVEHKGASLTNEHLRIVQCGGAAKKKREDKEAARNVAEHRLHAEIDDTVQRRFEDLVARQDATVAKQVDDGSGDCVGQGTSKHAQGEALSPAAHL